LNTKILLTVSTLFLGTIGLGLSFLPIEALNILHLKTSQTSALIMQLLGALYLGFGMMNWMAKGSIIGGIYNKPLVIGNLMHFAVGAITLLKVAFNLNDSKEVLIPLTIIYSLFALGFMAVFTKTPKAVN
jgi:hypothetical protein